MVQTNDATENEVIAFSRAEDGALTAAGGLSSKQEVTGTSIRVRTAMAVQAREQGRYLGGRPPYGSRLADAGPHPTRRTPPGAGAPTASNPTRSRAIRWRGSHGR